MAWQLQDAKNKFSEVVREAQKEPQVILVRGEEKAVVVSAERYRELTTSKGSLVSFLQTSPWAEVELDLERSKDTGREVEF
jgi:prevent-host-death family protein